MSSFETTTARILALKYRPQTFQGMFGNEDIVSILESYIRGDATLPHSILFHGPTGCGKTTLARIVAKELDVDSDDIHEVDSADFRGIDTIRDIRKRSVYKPFSSPYRVWILDECHKMTSDAQTALLKALEDTPAHVIFILCTTDPQKLLPTIRGRCAQFQVRPLLDKEMKRLLRYVVKSEGDSLDKTLYNQIVQDSLGSPRNALQILAQVLAVQDESKRLSIATRAAENQSATIDLCRALLKRDSWKKVANILKELKQEDPEQIRRAVLGYCQAVLLNSADDGTAVVMQEFLEPFYQSGYPGLVFACYSALFGDTE